MSEETYSISALIRKCLKKNKPSPDKINDADWKSDLNYWVPLFEKTFISEGLGLGDFYKEYKLNHKKKFNLEWYDLIEFLYFINTPKEENKNKQSMKASSDLRKSIKNKVSVNSPNYQIIVGLLVNAINHSGNDSCNYYDKLLETDFLIRHRREHLESEINSQIHNALLTIESNPEFTNQYKMASLNKIKESISDILKPFTGVIDEFVGFCGYAPNKNDNDKKKDTENHQER